VGNAPVVRIGFNARLFPNNWRPAREEIEFARLNGFRAIQFRAKEAGTDEAHLADPFATVAVALRSADVTVALEMVILLDERGRNAAGQTPLDVLIANLPCIHGLPCRYVHWHLAPVAIVHGAQGAVFDETRIRAWEAALVPQFEAGLALGQRHGFRFAVENNEPDAKLFATPASCQRVLEAVPGLEFVWDMNHTALEDAPGFQALAPRMSMLHVSDTPLPAVNRHLPLGQGSVDLEGYCRAVLRGGFRGPAILEIGGLPKYGLGWDTDEALINSRRLLLQAVR
jgi:L-ribulose-5-phosphate 3-epimerase